jgi:two-component system sensor kinase FixL
MNDMIGPQAGAGRLSDLDPSDDFDPQTAPEGRPAQGTPAGGARPARTFSLRLYLVAITLAVMLPMGLVGAIAIREAVNEYQTAYQQRLSATAKLLGLALDSEIEIRKTAIMALAASPLMDDLTSPELYKYAKQIGDGLGSWVTVKTPEKMLMSTRFPYGSPLPTLVPPVELVSAGHFVVTNIKHVPTFPVPFASIAGPVVRDGRVVATISIPFANEQLGRRLAEGLVTSDGVLCLLDGNGIVIARTRKHEQFIGKRVPDWLMAAVASPAPTIALGRLLDGGDVIAATGHPSEAPNWTVVVAQPVAGYDNEWFRPLLVLGGGGLVLLLALPFLVNRFALWLVRPLRTLTQNAEIVASGRWARLPEAHHASRVAEFETLRVSLNEAAHVMDGRAEAIRVAFASARRERNLLHSVVNGTADPTFVTDTEGRLVLSNAAGLAMLGEPAAKVVGQMHREPGVPSGDAEAHPEDCQVVASGQPLMIERTVVIGDERRNFLGAKSPWRNASGEILGVVTIIHDVTEWSRSESRLRALQAELIRTGRLSAMGAMANGLAHELNQPLSAITNYLGAARRLIAQGPAAEGAPARAAGAPAANGVALGVARGAIEDACTQAMRAGEIVSRLREFIGRGVAETRIESIGGMIDDACALALPQDTRSRVSLHVSVDADVAPVFADRPQIEQVLVNLLLNGVQSMEGAARQVLTIAAARDAAGDTCIRVSDTGSGIPDTMLAEMFEPFVTTRSDGLGMGLAIARMIVTAHGGTLAASNNADGGATLVLVLPAALSMEMADA